MNVPDSIETWRQRGLVVIPVSAASAEMQADASTGHYLLFGQRSTTDGPQ
jgi:hypothetical protein